MNIVCPNVSPCLTDDQYVNLSSEAPDSNPYLGLNFGDPQAPPTIGKDWTTSSCLGVCESTVSQEAADQCAANAQLICVNGGGKPQPGSGGTGQAPGPGSPSGPFGGTTSKPGPTISGAGVFPPPKGQVATPTFGSARVSCMAACPDGTSQLFTLPAGYVQSTSQAQADKIAASMCPSLAIKNLNCPCKLPSFTCIQTLYDEICTPRLGGMSPPLKFSGSGFPPGINVSSAEPAFANSASVFGKATAAGDFTGHITITDAGGKMVSQDYPLTVLGLGNGPAQADPLADTGYSVTLPSAHVGTHYTQQLTTAGGTKPITFSVDDAMVPSGLTCSSSGTIDWDVECTDEDTDFYFDVTMTDKDGRHCTQTVKIPVEPLGDCFSNPHKLPDGDTGVVYTTQLVPNQPADPDYTMTIIAGGLPHNLTLDPTSGVITGTPDTYQKSEFTVSLTGVKCPCQQDFTIEIKCHPNISDQAPSPDHLSIGGAGTVTTGPIYFVQRDKPLGKTLIYGLSGKWGSRTYHDPNNGVDYPNGADIIIQIVRVSDGQLIDQIVAGNSGGPSTCIDQSGSASGSFVAALCEVYYLKASINVSTVGHGGCPASGDFTCVWGP